MESSASAGKALGAGDPAGKREVLAWGIETSSRRARHISELTAQQTGKASGIECVGCGLPLLAFNAGAKTWKRRPHFKHPKGTRREDCDIVAARVAVIEALTHGDVFTLPARRRAGHWVGLSGSRFDAWRNLPSEQVKVRRIDYQDRARALIHLADGRRIVVMLRGDFSMQASDEDGKTACLAIEAGADAESLSQLDPEELRQRITLLPDLLDWRCHWQDQVLDEAAEKDAKEQARQALDEWPAHLEHEAQGDRRRETLLHRMVREILAEALAIDVPGWRIAPEPGDARVLPPIPGHRLSLSGMHQERGLAGRIPDIQCAATAENPALSLPLLVIEVVVHNSVDPGKLQDLRAAGAAVLVVDLSNWGGHITPAELRSLVLVHLEAKRWLHHPLQAAQEAQVADDRALALAWRQWRLSEPAAGKRSSPAPAPDSDDIAAHQALSRFAAMYRDALVAYFDASRFDSERPALGDLLERLPARQDLWAHLCWLADELKALGAPGGVDGGHLFPLLSRMLSIREDRGVGMAPTQNARATINHVLTELKVRGGQDGAPSKPSPGASFAVMAFQAFEMRKRGKPASSPYEQVRSIIHASLQAYEDRFVWDSLYVPLLRAVFPEMATDIDRLARRMNAIAARPQAQRSPASARAHVSSRDAADPKGADVQDAPGHGRQQTLAGRGLADLSAQEMTDLAGMLRWPS